LHWQIVVAGCNPLLLILLAESASLLLLAPVPCLPAFGCLLQVGKHLNDAASLLPLRCVCREWREVATLGAVQATLDLEPRGPDNSISAKERFFVKCCPQLRKVTYHVSPWVSLAQVCGAGTVLVLFGTILFASLACSCADTAALLLQRSHLKLS
jgi:hypothetical protein